jgi:methyl acetate hydrolase
MTKVNGDGTAATRPARLPVTIRHLLTHTSGIGYGFSDPMLLQLTTKTGKPEVELPLLHDPGAMWTYGAGTRVLGEVIERVTSEPLDRFLETRILKPLGMTDTFYRVPDSKLPRVMSRHQRTDGRLVEEQVAAVEESPVRGDGGLYSTTPDYGRFLQFLLNDGRTKSGTRLLSQRSMNGLRANQIGSLFVTTQPDADPARTRPFPLGAGRDTFSLGFQIAAAPPRGRALRAKGSMSWGGLRNTHFWIDPQTRIGAVFMTQVLPFYDDEVMSLLTTFEETLYKGMD